MVTTRRLALVLFLLLFASLTASLWSEAQAEQRGAYRSNVIWCSARKGDSPFVFKMRFIGRDTRSSVNVTTLKYRISPRDTRSDENNLTIAPSAADITSDHVNPRTYRNRNLIRDAQWHSLSVNFTIAKLTSMSFKAIFDRPIPKYDPLRPWAPPSFISSNDRVCYGTFGL